MPVQKCQKDGQQGWRAWDEGTCFIGPDAKQRAEKQLQAIKINQSKAVEKYSHIDFKPTEAMAKAAKRGLEIREQQPPSNRCCTPTGLARARQLVNREKLSPETVRRMKAFFDRHSAFKDKHKDKTSKAWQSWAIWGSYAGQSWANARVRQMDAADKKARGGLEVTTVSENHLHTYSGGEWTSTDNGHAHKVISGMIIPTHNHTHELEM